jgi:Ca2+-binding EF-hand superfamily protein
MAAAAKLGGKANFAEARDFGNSKRKLSATERKSSVDGIDSKESRAVIKILSKGSIHAEAENLFKTFDKNLSKNLDREEFRRLLKDLDENKRDPLPANFE